MTSKGAATGAPAIPHPRLAREIFDIMTSNRRCEHTQANAIGAAIAGGLLVTGSVAEAERVGNPIHNWFENYTIPASNLPDPQGLREWLTQGSPTPRPMTISIRDLERKRRSGAVMRPMFFDNSAVLALVEEVIKWDVAVHRVLAGDAHSAKCLYRIAEDANLERMTAELEMALLENQRLRKALEDAERDARPMREARMREALAIARSLDGAAKLTSEDL